MSSVLNCKLSLTLISNFVWIRLVCLTDCCLTLGWKNGTKALIRSVSNLYSVEKSDIKLLQYNRQKMREATNNFHEENKLGEGGFGPVFKVLKQNSVLLRDIRLFL